MSTRENNVLRGTVEDRRNVLHAAFGLDHFRQLNNARDHSTDDAELLAFTAKPLT